MMLSTLLDYSMNPNLSELSVLRIFSWPLLFALALSCSRNENSIDTNERIKLQDTCNKNSNHSYELYIPSNAKDCSQLPLLVILDPHGHGKSAIENFIPAAERYKCMLVASNLVKNNSPDYQTEIDILIKDVRIKYPSNNIVYIAGFSGGARMALSFAQYHDVDGIIACGALVSANQIESINTTVFALTGMQDFNFIETAQYFFRSENTPENLRIELTDEMHEWPSEHELSNSIAYLILAENTKKIKCLDIGKTREQFGDSQKSRIDTLKKAGNYLSASLIAQNMIHLNDGESANQFQSIRNSLVYSEELNDELGRLRESIRFELTVRDTYLKALLSEDYAWWINEISSLNKKIRQDTDHYRNLAYKRIKAFLGIMCYTLTNKALQSGDTKSTGRLLSVYALVEPDNPDMFFFYAVYSKQTGRTEEVKIFLQKAIDAGFSDQLLLEKISTFN